MKRILLLVAVLTIQAYAAPLTAEENQKLDSASEECISETGVDKDAIKKLGRVSGQDQLFAKNDKLKQYLACFYTKIGIINVQGVVQKDTLKKGLSRDVTDEAKVDKIVEKCAVQKDTPQETAVEIMKCIQSVVV